MFCAIATTIERCKTEGVVDVFQVVKALRVQKPGAVQTVVSIIIAVLLSCFFYFHLCSCRNNIRIFLRQLLCFLTLLKRIQILVVS